MAVEARELMLTPESQGPTLVLESEKHNSANDPFYPEIQAILKDPSKPITEALRLIAIKMAQLASEIEQHRTDPNLRDWLLVANTQHQLLQSVVEWARGTERETQRKLLDLERPEYNYILEQLMNCHKEACEKALGEHSEEMSQRILLEFRDLVVVQEPEIRRGLKRLQHR
jgi:hypothetical protein